MPGSVKLESLHGMLGIHSVFDSINECQLPSQDGLGPGDSGDRDKVPSSELSVIWRKTESELAIGHLGLLSKEEAAEASKARLTCPRPATIPSRGPRIPSGVLYADLIWSPHHTYSPPR